MTTQELLDFELEKRKKYPICVDANGDCVYRNDFGNKCGVGWHIPDEFYDEEMENAGVENLLRTHGHKIFHESVWNVPVQDMMDLQQLHDSGLTMPKITNDKPNLGALRALDRLAKKCNLPYPLRNIYKANKDRLGAYPDTPIQRLQLGLASFAREYS